MPLKFGLGFFSGQVPLGSERTVATEYAETIRLCELAESVGFDSVWVTEHHGAADSYLPSLNVLLAAVAARTQRVRLAMGVALAPFQHPLRFAEDCAVVDQISNGRLVVGLAPGWREEEFRAFGIPISERVRRTIELVEICRLAWTEARFSFQGRHHRFDHVAVTPKPCRVPPIFMGGFAEKAVARAARLADGFIASRPNPDGFRNRIQILDASAREAGRDPAQLLLGINLYCWVSRDGSVSDEVKQAVWNAQGTYVAWAQSDTPDAPLRLPPINHAMLDSVLQRGTPEQLAERLRQWIDVAPGRDLELVVRVHFPGMRYDQSAPAIELFAQEVIPRLRAG